MKRPNSTSLVLFGFSLGLFASANASTIGSAVFSDVPGGAYFDAATGDMYAAGIITGYDDGRFGPNDYVTRGQVAVMLQRFKAHLTGTNIAVSSSSRSRASSTSSSSSSTSSSVAPPPPSGAGSFRFTTGSYKIDEDGGQASISVVRYGGKTGTVGVKYTTSNGTAESGTDYDVTENRLIFPDGSTSQTFTFPIHDDNESEGNETVTLTLSDPSGDAALGGPVVATLTIIDNDAGDGSSVDTANNKGVFTFSALEYEVSEAGGDIEITVNRVGTQGDVTVKFATSDGTANSSYYDTNSGTLDFADGESSKTFTVTINDNNATNGNKTVNLKLSNPTGNSELGSLSTAPLIIVDNEVSTFGNGKFRLKETDVDAYEGDSVILTIDRMGGADGDVTVEYETQNSLAKAGEDYTETAGTLTFRDHPKSGLARK